MSETDCPPPERLQQLVAGTLSLADRDAVLAHVDGCTACHAAVTALRDSDVGATADTALDDGGQRRSNILGSGTRVGRYRVERPIGMGGMGVVYVAHDPELDRKVAVKLLRRGNAGSVERLRREGRALAALTHPNVVAVHDVGDHEDELFIAMEFVDGDNLRGWLTQKRRSWREIVDVALAVGRGLEAAHIAGLVHRDIKPDNILLGTDGRIRVGDFGLVNELPSVGDVGDVELTQTGALLGTPAYMSPEQLDGAEVDARSDQWSFCATVFEALYGVRAFAGKSVDELSVAIEDGEITETSRSGVPSWLRRILVRGLAVEPRKRWPSMRALCDAIERGRRRRKQLVVLAPIAIVALGSGGAWLATRPTPVDCSDAGAIPEAAWSPARRALVAVMNPKLVPELDQWIAEWSAARVEACHTNVGDDDVRARRNACLDHQLDRLAKLVDVWGRFADADMYAEVYDLRDVMPSISRCAQSAIAGQPEPTLAQRTKALALEADMARALALRRGGDASAVTRIGTQALTEAKASGYAPAVVDVALPLSAYLNSDYDNGGEEAAYRAGLEAAETARDDGAKTVMCVRLAGKLAINNHVDEAKHFLALGKASAARLPQTPLLEAEIAQEEALVLQGAGDYRAEVVAIRRGIELRARVFGELDRKVRQQMALLAAALDQYDVAEAARVRAHLDDLDAKAGPDSQGDVEVKKVPRMMEDAMRAVNSGDIDRAARVFDDITAIGERGLGSQPRLAEWHQSAAVIEQAAQHLDRAARHFTRAIAIWDDAGVKNVAVATTLGWFAGALNRSGRATEAVPVARRGVDMARELGNGDVTSNNQVELGDALLAVNDPTGARQPLEAALAWRQDHGVAGARGRVKFVLARALWVGNDADHKRALELARSGRSDLAASIASMDLSNPIVRYSKPVQDKLLADLDAWLHAHH